MHLTNYYVNKLNPEFEKVNMSEAGHKRSLQFTWDYLEEKGHNVEKLLDEIKDAIIKTIVTVQPSIAHTYKSLQPDDPYNSM